MLLASRSHLRYQSPSLATLPSGKKGHFESTERRPRKNMEAKTSVLLGLAPQPGESGRAGRCRPPHSPEARAGWRGERQHRIISAIPRGLSPRKLGPPPRASTTF